MVASASLKVPPIHVGTATAAGLGVVPGPTRGFSVLVTPFQPRSFNNLAGSLPDYCTTARNRAPLIHAKFTRGV